MPSKNDLPDPEPPTFETVDEWLEDMNQRSMLAERDPEFRRLVEKVLYNPGLPKEEWLECRRQIFLQAERDPQYREFLRKSEEKRRRL